MNEDKFTGKAELYKKFRPTYPKDFLDYLYSQTGFTKDSVIADIGAGTGIFTRLLLECGSKVYAIEPNEDMRETCKKDLSEYQNFISVNAPAEKTGLRETSVDFVTIAQAFHYFDRQLFKQECRRILKPGGKVIIVKNASADSDEDIILKNEDIIAKYRIHAPAQSGQQKSGDLDEYADFFTDGIYEYKTFDNDLYENREHFIGGMLSASFSPSEEREPEKYYGFAKELNGLFDEYNINGILRFPQITKSYIGNVD
ncbi:MAG: class I SAM-dependent methyltransferase [Oscillospiraceae bacterium]|nr:class I SAM-dependent methyltransferase [Oscillospiraceae bacterium]